MATATKTQAQPANKKSKSASDHGSKTTTNHDEIRKWVEERGGKPATVKGTGNKKDGIGILRIDFPGYSGEDSLQEIGWDEFFNAFDTNDLEFLYQNKTESGKKSHFNKFVSRVG